MKREDIIAKLKEYKQENEKDIVDYIMNLNGNDINEYKGYKEKVQTHEATIADLTKQLGEVKTEYETFKESKMTEEEKQKKQLEDAEKERQRVLDEAKAEAAKYRKLSVEAKVKNVFASEGFVEDDYKDIIGGLVTQDEKVALDTATNFVKMIKAQKDLAAKLAVDKALKGMPDPSGNNDDKGNKPAYTVPLVF